MPDEQWYALESGEQRGPFTRAALTARIGAGAPVALVWRDGMTGWVPPQDVGVLEEWAADDAAPLSVTDAFRAVARSYGAAVRSTSECLHELDTRQGDLTVRLTCSVSRDGASGELRLQRLGVAYPALLVRSEDDMDRTGKRLGIDLEAQIHDDVLDRAAYFETALPDAAVRDMVGRPGFRQALDRWLARGAESIRLDEDGLTVRLPLRRADALTPERVQAELAALAQAADALRGLDAGLRRYRRPYWPETLAVLGLVGAVVGVPCALWAHDLWEPAGLGPLFVSVGAGVALAGAVVGAMFLRLRGTPGAYKTLVFGGVALLVALPSLATACLLAANGLFDRGETVVHETVVKGQGRGKRRTGLLRFVTRNAPLSAYVLETHQGWRFRWVRVDGDTYYRVRRGEPLRVRVRPGALGWEWDASVDEPPSTQP
jgi:peptidoglycan/xylan/chitin deacetylase (PgdA/CDA1 family)